MIYMVEMNLIDKDRRKIGIIGMKAYKYASNIPCLHATQG